VNGDPPIVALVLETASLVFRQPVRGEDSLFELGVDSLSVIEYCRRLEERLGIEVELEELFAAESLASLGAILADRVISGKAQ
jgi:acyl carrier protein